jgi:hypothetical protein
LAGIERDRASRGGRHGCRLVRLPRPRRPCATVALAPGLLRDACLFFAAGACTHRRARRWSWLPGLLVPDCLQSERVSQVPGPSSSCVPGAPTPPVVHEPCLVALILALPDGVIQTLQCVHRDASFRALGGSRWEYLPVVTLPETSNCYCHPGKAGGTPVQLGIRDARAGQFPLCLKGDRGRQGRRSSPLLLHGRHGNILDHVASPSVGYGERRWLTTRSLTADPGTPRNAAQEVM